VAGLSGDGDADALTFSEEEFVQAEVRLIDKSRVSRGRFLFICTVPTK
jgi:hypothetical protein